jgi:hypothetical protein
MSCRTQTPEPDPYSQLVECTVGGVGQLGQGAALKSASGPFPSSHPDRKR